MDENEIEIDGVRYVAVGVNECHGCDGCAAQADDDICGAIHDANAYCGNDVREDGREVIWKKATD